MSTDRGSGPRSSRPVARTAARNVVVGVVLAGLVLGACSDDQGDQAAFCDAVDELRRNDPFAELEVASPGEMRDAFADLGERVDRIAEVAPRDVRPQSVRYADAVDALRDELAGAGYVLTRVDRLRYGQAVAAYTEAAVSVRNAAEAGC